MKTMLFEFIKIVKELEVDVAKTTEKSFNLFSVLVGFFGGCFVYFLGGWDSLLRGFVALVIIDYVAGILKGIYQKKLSSNVCFKGIVKKFMAISVIALACVLQDLLKGLAPFREIALLFFIANEGISILENASVVIPVPKKIKDVLIQLRDKTNDNSSNNDKTT